MGKNAHRNRRGPSPAFSEATARLHDAAASFDRAPAGDEETVVRWREAVSELQHTLMGEIKGNAYNPCCDGVSAHAYAALLKLDGAQSANAFTFACEMLNQCDIAKDRVDDILVHSRGIDGLIDWLCDRGAALVADPHANAPSEDHVIDMPSWATAESLRILSLVLPLSEAVANTFVLHPKWNFLEETVLELLAMNINSDLNGSVRLFLQNQMCQHCISKAFLKTALKRSGIGARLLSTVVKILDTIWRILANGDVFEAEGCAAVAQISAMCMNSMLEPRLKSMWARALCEAQVHRVLLNIVHFDSRNSLSVVAMRALMDAVSTMANECPDGFNVFLSGGDLPMAMSTLKRMMRHMPAGDVIPKKKDQLEDAVLVASEEAALVDFQLLCCAGHHYPDQEVRHFAYKGVAAMHKYIMKGSHVSTFGKFIDIDRCQAPEIISGSEEGGDYTLQGALMITDAGCASIRAFCKERGWKGKYKAGEAGGSPRFSRDGETFRGSGVFLRGKINIEQRTCSMCKQEEVCDKGQFKACAGCSAAWYCSPQCQHAHWKLHKQTCPRHDKSIRNQKCHAPHDAATGKSDQEKCFPHDQ